MAQTIKSQITARIAELLGQIKTADGYRTDIGRHVLISATAANPHEVPGAVITPGRETAAKGYSFAARGAEYRIFAQVNRLETPLASVVYDNPAEYQLQDAISADICQVLEGGDATLGALIDEIAFAGLEPQDHEGGGELTGVELVYNVFYSINAGDPDTQP